MLISIYNKTKATLYGLKDPAYLLIQIQNYIRGGVSLDRKHYYFFINFFHLVLPSLSKKQPLIIDVGSNDGWFLRVINRFLPAAKVVCIEPLSFLLPKLEALSQKISNEVNILNFALGYKAVPNIEIHQYESHGISSILELEENNISYMDKGKNLTLVEKAVVE